MRSKQRGDIKGEVGGRAESGVEVEMRGGIVGRIGDSVEDGAEIRGQRRSRC